MVVQFICRGNAFRSIIAETYLNSLRIPGVTVLSSGTVGGAHKDSNAESFSEVVALLRQHGTGQYMKGDYGDDVSQDLLDRSDVVICLNKRIYNELASSYVLPQKTYVWDITDMGEAKHVPITEQERTYFLETTYQKITADVDAFVVSQNVQS